METRSRLRTRLRARQALPKPTVNARSLDVGRSAVCFGLPTTSRRFAPGCDLRKFGLRLHVRLILVGLHANLARQLFRVWLVKIRSLVIAPDSRVHHVWRLG
jgi:hypothetical protein